MRGEILEFAWLQGQDTYYIINQLYNYKSLTNVSDLGYMYVSLEKVEKNIGKNKVEKNCQYENRRLCWAMFTFSFSLKIPL